MKNILEFLETTAPRFPEKTAIADEYRQLTFSSLLEKSRRGGSCLLGSGACNEPVVVFLPKSPDTIAAFMAVVYSGCYYVPMDIGMPRHRIRMILQKLSPRFIICDDICAPVAREFAPQARLISPDQLFAAEEDTAALLQIRETALDIDPVYIVFTSGSTGVPKGVTACHRSLIDYAAALLPVLKSDETSVFAMQVPLYVDACWKELLSMLCRGSEIWLMPQALFVMPLRAVAYLNEHRINSICWVASALTLISGLGAFDEVQPAYLRLVCFGSEVFPVKQLRLWQKAAPCARFINLYGPTECTGMSFYYEVLREFDDNEVIPIGKPFDNTGYYLLKDDGTPAEPGQTGEICIRGTAVTLGYYEDTERTNAVFVQNPLNTRWRETIYKTGDLARLNTRGELVFVSRKDNQIKNMGHRIELGEIELCACSCEGIANACCLWDTEKKKLILYYMGTAEGKTLQTWLRKELPRHMIPGKLFALDTLPMLPNGKLDRKALMEQYRETNK